MKLISKLVKVTSPAFYLMLGVSALLIMPGMLAAAFTLIGFDLDWSTWKTYLGIMLISVAMLMT
ncbi:hypothetical protein [Halomonas sp. YLGW01]|uniref:hypothetical protein n=1 Tax=Halomonas sp. YLGW01 TaxID=2773308 RepID=UPI001A914681|nr:hypothetical protein [Halomonas sp. YLGW01]